MQKFSISFMVVIFCLGIFFPSSTLANNVLTPNNIHEDTINFPLLTFSSTSGYDVIKISAQPSEGFEWPFYLGIPSTLSTNTKLLVCPNNTGTGDDDPQVHDDSAYQQALSKKSTSIFLTTPVLVPTFPRPYTNWQVLLIVSLYGLKFSDYFELIKNFQFILCKEVVALLP